MSHNEARAWWAEVEHLRERIEDERTHPPLRIAAAPAASERTRPEPIVITGRGAPAPAIAPLRLVDDGEHSQHRAAPARPSSRVRARARALDRSTQRPDRAALWAVLLGFALVLVCVASADAATSLGERTLKAPMEGRDVRQLQLELRRTGLLSAPATAHFGSLTRSAVRRFQRSHCLTVDGIAGPATIAALRSHRAACHAGGPKAAEAPQTPSVVFGAGLRDRVVTWYGPGLWGHHTACGQRLTHRLLGVAHRTLPCGTHVRLRYGSRDIVAEVVDRGPFTDGVQYDLTYATAQALGLGDAGRAVVRASR